jgi:hypothetical protein
MKTCNKCGIEKLLSEFSKDVSKKDGIRNSCKQCAKEKYLSNRENEIQRSKTYQRINREKVLKQKLIHAKKYFVENHDKIKEYQKKYKANRRKNDFLFKLADNMRTRVYRFLKKNEIHKTNRTFDLVGCSPLELKKHLEEKFIDDMCWDNQGKWHIDHITPLSSAKTEEELYKLCHFTNLQPMWATDNIKKGSKII